MVPDKLMIVAHPDDETIFGGAQLIREKGWLVVCVTNGDNRVRRKEFRKAMSEVGAESEMWAYPDEWDGDFDRGRLRADIAGVLVRSDYHKIVTHGLRGEYGHTQHIALSQIVHELVHRRLYVFELSKQPLSEPLLAKKRKLVECYESQDIEWLDRYVRYESIREVL